LLLQEIYIISKEILSYQEKEFSSEKKILFNKVLLKGTELTESKARKLLHLPDGCEVQL
jgi:hypothetical protein